MVFSRHHAYLLLNSVVIYGSIVKYFIIAIVWLSFAIGVYFTGRIHYTGVIRCKNSKKHYCNVLKFLLFKVFALQYQLSFIKHTFDEMKAPFSLTALVIVFSLQYLQSLSLWWWPTAQLHSAVTRLKTSLWFALLQEQNQLPW